MTVTFGSPAEKAAYEKYVLLMKAYKRAKPGSWQADQIYEQAKDAGIRARVLCALTRAMTEPPGETRTDDPAEVSELDTVDMRIALARVRRNTGAALHHYGRLTA